MPFVFGYGSLVDRDSVQASLGRELAPQDGPHPVRLSGHRRAWNVAVHSSVRPDYALTLEDGSPWNGWIGFLGVEEAPHASTLGAVVAITEAELLLLDSRERSYDRVDVAHLLRPVDPLDRAATHVPDEPVHLYRPRADVVADAEREGEAVAVMARYLRLVDRAYRTLGAELYAEHLASLPDPAPFRVLEVSARPVVAGTRSEVVDPAADLSEE